MLTHQIRELGKSFGDLVDSVTLTEEGWETLREEIFSDEKVEMGHPFGLSTAEYTIWVYKK